jgi:hypothetical protein
MDVCVTAVAKSKTREWLLSESRKQASKQKGAGGNSQWEIHGRKDESRLYVPWGSHGRASLVLLACLVGWELKIVDDMEDVPGGNPEGRCGTESARARTQEKREWTLTRNGNGTLGDRWKARKLGALGGCNETPGSVEYGQAGAPDEKSRASQGGVGVGLVN